MRKRTTSEDGSTIVKNMSVKLDHLRDCSTFIGICCVLTL